MLRSLLATAALAAAGLALGVSCDAKIIESCLDGDCTLGGGGARVVIPTMLPSSASSSGGDGGVDAGPDADAKGCPTIPQTGDFPCDVFAVIHSVCNHCHTNPQLHGAPFQILTYADTQQPYHALIGESCKDDADCGPTPGNCVDKNDAGVGLCDGLRFQQMFISIGPNGCPQMPFGEGMLPNAPYKTLHDWLGNCAPPVDAGTGCGCPGNGCN
jgi:hypothetical protein